MSGKKKLLREESNSSFFQNYEVQAEQLKYAVRKEVEEANLIAEAMKSLQRSFKVEEFKRKRAEENNIKLKDQIRDLESKAKQYKELIRELRKEASMYTNEPVENSDSDEEYEEVDEDESEDESTRKENDAYEELLRELSEGSQPQTQPHYNTLLSERDGYNQSLKEKQKAEKQMNNHKELMKLWLKREKQLSKLPRGANQISHGDESKFQAILFEFAAEEDIYSATMDNIFKKYITPLLSIIPSYELNAIFSNFVTLITIQNQFKDKLNFFIDSKCSFHDITSFLEGNISAYQEYVDNRDLASKALENLLENPDIARYFNEKFQMKKPYDEMSILLDSPIQQLCKYANQFSELLYYVDENKVEFEYISTALATIKRILSHPRYLCTLIPPPGKSSLIELQILFDWRNKGASFVEPHRKFIANDILRRKSNKAKDKFKQSQIYLFNDALVFTTKVANKLIFKSFIPIENVLIWDIPFTFGSKDYFFQVANCETGKKYTFVVNSQEAKAKWVGDISRAMLTYNPIILQLPNCLRF